MTETTNLGLKKPGAADNVAIADLNANADKLDAIIGLLSSLSTTEKSSLVAAMNELWSISPTVTLQNTFASGMIPAVKVTITDKDGDHEFTIKDGKAGKNGTAGQHGDSVAVTVLPLNATEEHTSGGQQLTFKKTAYASGGGSSISTENVQLWNGNNADISFGITGASVGQVLQIAAVDENGAPTAWEAV
nr:MAG TPA: hypothetical protein [Caudoviricetes sp.]